jgi:PAS domain S-box-containing protein
LYHFRPYINPIRSPDTRCIAMTDTKDIEKTGTFQTPPIRYSRFEELINLLPQAVIEITFDGTLIFLNWHCRKLFGYGVDEVLESTKNIFDHVAPADHEVIIKRITKIRTGEQARPSEITAIRKNGTTFPAIVYANIVMTAGVPSGVRVVIADITEKKEVEEAYKTLVDHSLQGLIIIQDERPVFVNDYFVRNSGLTREELLSLPSGAMWQMIHPEDREALVMMYHYLLNGRIERAPVLEYRLFIKGPDGPELRWLADYSSRIEYRGRPALQTTLVDVTERKLSEITLKESEKRYRDLAELLPQGIFEADRQGLITYANRSALEMYGITLEDIREGYTIADSTTPDERDRITGTFKRILSGEKGVQEEYACIRKDGSVFPSLILANAIIRGGLCDGIRGVVADITIQKEMMNRLEESEARYRTLFNSTGTSTVLIEEDMTISLANEEFYRFSGYPPATELKFPALIHDDDREFMMEYHRKRRIDAQSVPRSYEFRHVRRNGEVGNAFLTIGMIPGTKRSVASIVDITDLKHIQEELRTKSSNLEDANAALRVLLKHREEDKAELEKNILTNLKEVVFPFLDKLKVEKLSSSEMGIVSIIEQNLREVTSPFLRNISSRYSKLTPREIEILVLVKEGRSTKEISRILNTSERTIDFQRNGIRKKMGITKRKINLRTFIMTQEDFFR